MNMTSITSSRHRVSLFIPTLLLDSFVVMLAGLAAYSIRFGDFPWPLPAPYLILIAGTGLATIPIFAMFGPSVFSRGVRFWYLVRQIIYGVVFLSVIVVITLWAIKYSSVFSRKWVVIWVVLICGGLTVARLLLIGILGLLRQSGVNQKRLVIVGAGPMGRSLEARVNAAAWPGFQLVGIFDRRRTNKTVRSEVPVYNNFDELPEFVEHNNIQEIWIALPLTAEKHIEAIAEKMLQTTATVRFVPDTFGLRLTQHRVTEIHGMPMLDLSTSQMVGLNRAIKAGLDYSITILILFIIGPLLMLPIAIAIKVASDGPVLFKQKRSGWDGRKFTVYKFRTMFVHKEDDGRVTQASSGDSRITPIGRFLRRTSLDELPQFINVLQGRMSIVGPRPHAVEHNEEYKKKIRHYMRRHKVKPGITGFAQINGWRGETNTVHKMRKRVQYDLYYLENWSVGFDIKIIWLTIFRGFVHRSAY